MEKSWQWINLDPRAYYLSFLLHDSSWGEKSTSTGLHNLNFHRLQYVIDCSKSAATEAPCKHPTFAYSSSLCYANRPWDDGTTIQTKAKAGHSIQRRRKGTMGRAVDERKGFKDYSADLQFWNDHSRSSLDCKENIKLGNYSI